MQKGFWHQQFDEASFFLTTFSTEPGRFCYTAMPFEATIASDMFQHQLDECFGKIEQVIIIADDIVIAGYIPDHSDHDQAFTALLQTAQKYNVKFNYEQLQYKQDEVDSLVKHILQVDASQVKMVAAITSMPSPMNKKQVQSFIGMINYLSKFSLRFSELAEPIRELSKDKVPFTWGPEHQQAFIQMKKEIASAPILAYYKPKKQTTLQTDANIKGLGACLLQGNKPVYFASKTLIDVQKGYVELESLAVAWDMEKFPHFLYAIDFLLETDQKPLEAILLKSLNQATPRLQGVLIRTFAYHFSVKYIPGSTNQLADCLSQLGVEKDAIKLSKLHIHQITSQLNARSDSMNDIRIVTQEDDELALLKHTIMHGWPSTIREVPSEIQPYWTFREELTIEDGIVLKGTWIVVPYKKYQTTLQLIHEGHLGLVKYKLRAKDTVYWPGLKNQLEKLILNCELCLKYSQSKCKPKPSTSLGQEIPVYPWSKLATDIFHFEGASYLLIVDYTSRFPILCNLTSVTGVHVAKQCKCFQNMDGLIPSSDNGSCYTSQACTSVMQAFSVNHITSSPHYPQSNRLAEKYVHIVKCCLTKPKKKGKISTNI